MELEELLTVHIQLNETITLDNNKGDSVVMITFKGHATGNYFNGEIQEGGVDTQIINKSSGHHTLSARYIIDGTDYTGALCKIFIENNGNAKSNCKDVLFQTHPKIITNSEALAFLNGAALVAEAVEAENGLQIRIYRLI
ncbi:DUF3237 family protein [Saliterribacillus persicus]|uniref:Uncharacterized protein DUF3237 n=1 Tax=Saliterribacillus persicus TaxID=930114 RepID=A0A368YGM0_9BACI|nr:DUF3237 family protein [Saliterribacillus persicus]RCW77334.1 uncharacterized protein DUF3237 [Saliterribacillus persicus]